MSVRGCIRDPFLFVDKIEARKGPAMQCNTMKVYTDIVRLVAVMALSTVRSLRHGVHRTDAGICAHATI
jgi:hypothetical protein